MLNMHDRSDPKRPSLMDRKKRLFVFGIFRFYLGNNIDWIWIIFCRIVSLVRLSLLFRPDLLTFNYFSGFSFVGMNDDPFDVLFSFFNLLSSKLGPLLILTVILCIQTDFDWFDRNNLFLKIALGVSFDGYYIRSWMVWTIHQISNKSWNSRRWRWNSYWFCLLSSQFCMHFLTQQFAQDTEPAWITVALKISMAWKPCIDGIVMAEVSTNCNLDSICLKMFHFYPIRIQLYTRWRLLKQRKCTSSTTTGTLPKQK